MRLVDADVVKEVLRYRVSESIDECINNVPTVDVLNKIRAEIIAKHLKNIEHDDYSNGYSVALEEILSVINKYKAEVEPQERSRANDIL